MWLSRHASELVESLPRPDESWCFGDTDLSFSVFMQLKTRGLIERACDSEDGKWVTPWSTLRHVSDYGRCDTEDVGIVVTTDCNNVANQK